MVTSDRIADPAEIYDYPLGTSKKRNETIRRLYTFFPIFLRVIFGDIFTCTQNLNPQRLNYEEDSVVFVWEKHDLFSGPGRKLAKTLRDLLVRIYWKFKEFYALDDVIIAFYELSKMILRQYCYWLGMAQIWRLSGN